MIHRRSHASVVYAMFFNTLFISLAFVSLFLLSKLAFLNDCKQFTSYLMVSDTTSIPHIAILDDYQATVKKPTV